MASVTYNFIKKLFSLMSKKSGDENEEVLSQSSKPKSILMEIQKILIWDDPVFSCCCMICVNVVFWLIIYLDFKFYGILFTTLLILTCEQLWMEHFSKYLHKNITSSENVVTDSLLATDNGPAEINTFLKKGLILLKETFLKARSLRQSQPGMFCILTCLSFLLLGVIGTTLSGVLALYILLMLIMTVPGALVRLLPQHVIKGLSDFFYSSREENFNGIDYEVEPFLPDTSEEALELLRLAGDVQLPNKKEDEELNDLLLERLSERTSDTTESVCSKMSLYPESTVMPSPENSMDFWDFDLPSKEKAEFNETESINFQSKHFDGDSSEEEFVKGLDLTGGSTKMDKKGEKQELTSVLTPESLISVNKKFLVQEEKQKDCKGSDKETSSDTDSFELVSDGDM